MTAITGNPITLHPSHRLALCAGLHRATAYRLRAEPFGGDGTMWQTWHVTSHSARTDPTRRPYHVVTIDQTRPDATAVNCTCEGAQAGRVCMHVALALVEAEALPYPLEGFICPHCQRVFDTAHDATVHTLTAHQTAPRGQQPIDPEVARRVLGDPLLATARKRAEAVL